VTDWIQRPLLTSQYAAERNAQQATIALARLRREKEAVERFLVEKDQASHQQSEAGTTLPPPFLAVQPSADAIGTNPARRYGSAASRALAKGPTHRRRRGRVTGPSSSY
jgi:hypothetical protein